MSKRKSVTESGTLTATFRETKRREFTAKGAEKPEVLKPKFVEEDVKPKATRRELFAEPESKTKEVSEREKHDKQVKEEYLENIKDMINADPDLTTDELLLAQFDADFSYGPILGLTRKERWFRAEKGKMKPPQFIMDILEKEEKSGKKDYVCDLAESPIKRARSL